MKIFNKYIAIAMHMQCEYTDVLLQNKHFKEYAYKQFLLPSIEYCCAIWDPYHQNDIYKLEMIQHRAAHFVLNKPWIRHHLDYHRNAK